MKGNKEIERKGMEILKQFLSEEFSNKEIEEWDKHKIAEYGCDLIITVDNVDYFIELKSSSRHPYRDNLRMTPSTITRCANKGVLDKLIIALVTNVFSETEPHVSFIPFCNIESDRFFVDVKFGFKPHHVEEINFSGLALANSNLSDKQGVNSHLQFALADKLGIKPS
ncbi:hypothetical protein [Neptuniibacter sp. QD37_11]|uniref:hypothetical protein n=1 Tax=Neptuniibacter sp. QD37_11 TaxID=3398209 RepID=UPI0039F459E8